MATPTPGAAVPLDQPLYGATFRQAAARLFRKYATFRGRASRSEFWWAQLCITIVMLASVVPFLVTMLGQIVSTIGYALGASGSSTSTMPLDVVGWMLGSIAAMLPIIVVSFALMVPTYALGARRLHDAGLSGWFIAIAPFTGGVLSIVIGFLPSSIEGLQHERPGSVPLLAPGLVAPTPGYGGWHLGAPYGVVGQPFVDAPSGPPR